MEILQGYLYPIGLYPEEYEPENEPVFTLPKLPGRMSEEEIISDFLYSLELKCWDFTRILNDLPDLRDPVATFQYLIPYLLSILPAVDGQGWSFYKLSTLLSGILYAFRNKGTRSIFQSWLAANGKMGVEFHELYKNEGSYFMEGNQRAARITFLHNGYSVDQAELDDIENIIKPFLPIHVRLALPEES